MRRRACRSTTATHPAANIRTACPGRNHERFCKRLRGFLRRDHYDSQHAGLRHPAAQPHALDRSSRHGQGGPMSDFSSEFWPFYVGIITLVSIIACAILLYNCTTKPVAKGEQVDTTGHVWDEDLAEWNNPLPRWWMWMFYITIVFSLVYLALYPG